VQHQWRRNVQAEARARLQALQSRIRPHFLFNSMNTIAGLTRERPELAEEVVEDLADLFRAGLADSRQRVGLGEEIEMARRYLRIEALRLGDRLRVDWRIGDLPLDLPVPPLILQPLLENAVYHGIEPRAEGGEIRVEGRREGGAVVFVLRNPVHGAAPRRREGHRMALENIRQRLALAYGDEGALTVRSTDGVFEVRIRLPGAPLGGPADAPASRAGGGSP
jgi:two-component system sensor histidine kinase AlgZ